MTRDASTRYVRAVGEAFARIRGADRVLSPREWALVAGWHARGIPLSLVLETLEECGRRRGAGPPRTLRALSRLVDEAWETVVENRAPSGGGRAGEAARIPGLIAAIERWREAAQRAPHGSAIAALLRSLVARLDEGADPCEIDRELDRLVVAAAPPDLRGEAEARTDRLLAPHRGRMTPHALAATRDRALADRLRKALGLPRLALTDAGS